jgi:murein DD-endopeptidase MepM/ murein hydrolase activator NlpD
MSKLKFRPSLPLIVLASFAAGVLVDGYLRTNGPPRPAPGLMTDPVMAATPRSSRTASKDASAETPAPSARTAATVGTTGGVSTSNGHLRVPIDGIDIESFKGGFAERRGGDRPHEAVDVLSPRNTPVHAVENGTIAKLFYSKAGGLTIYQFDPSSRFCYYYAHLERYADGLHDGQTITQGEVIGYVGTSGNAPANTPHLHFAVFELKGDRKWWQGTALDPYGVFKERG